MPQRPSLHGTTILAVRHRGSAAIAGDGQVTLGQTVVKHTARKIRRFHNGQVLAGFAGGSADALALFAKLESRIEAYLKKIDALGGMVAAIGAGYPQQEIQDSAYRAQRALESRESVVVGVNEYREEEPPPEGLLRVNETLEKTQAARLQQLRSERDAATVKRRLDALRAAAKDEKQNLVPAILEAVKSLATLGEISDALRDVFGEHRENVVL